MRNIRWEHWAAVAVCVAAGIVVIAVGAKIVFSVLLPFLLAWCVSLLITPAAKRIANAIRMPEKAIAVLLLLLFLTGSVLAVGFSVNRILRETGQLAQRLLSDARFPEGIVSESVDYFETFTSRVGFLRRMEAGERYGMFRDRFNEMVASFLDRAAASLGEAVPKAAGKLVSAFPSVLLFLVVTVIAGFYFCTDRHGIEHAVGSILPAAVRDRVPAWKARIRRFAGRYLRAYLILFLLTFAEMFAGFLILGIDYAFLLALFVAVVDFFPILGVGTVLVPWAVVELIRKRFYIGFGLLILCGASALLREIMEPRVVGKSLGIHPLLTLVCGYVGWNLFGVAGMLFSPAVAVTVKALWAGRNAGSAGQDAPGGKV